MKLLTKEIEKKMPALYGTEGEPLDKKRVYLKLFTPWARWTWYIVEANWETGEMFGWVESGLDPNFDELGYCDLNELADLKGPAGLKIERDMFWDDTKTLADVMEKSDAGKGLVEAIKKAA